MLCNSAGNSLLIVTMRSLGDGILVSFEMYLCKCGIDASKPHESHDCR